MQKGVQNIQVGGTYTLYQGRLFYTGRTTNNATVQLSDALAARAVMPPDRSGNGNIKIYGFHLFIDENEEIVGVRRRIPNPIFDPPVMGRHIGDAD